MDVICDACGEANRPGQEFCSSCHAFLAWNALDVEEPAPRPEAAPPVTPGPAAPVSEVETPTLVNLPRVPPTPAPEPRAPAAQRPQPRPRPRQVAQPVAPEEPAASALSVLPLPPQPKARPVLAVRNPTGPNGATAAAAARCWPQVPPP